MKSASILTDVDNPPAAKSSADPLIEVRSLRKRFGAVLAVADISLTVHRGEVLGFLGPNGAGKSTTMKILTGFLAATAGRAFICGIDIESNPMQAKRHIGYLPEGAPLYGDMTPEAFLGFAAAVRGFSGRERASRVESAIERMSLREVLYRPVDALSKGFRRRLGLAQAIIHDPDVLVLDEPTDGLDPNQKQEVRNLVREMGREKAIIISTHLLEEVDAVCDRAIIIDRGRIVGEGTPASFHARAREHNAVTIRVADCDAARLAKLLREHPEVNTVESAPAGSGQTDVTAFPHGGRFIADQVGAIVRGGGIQVFEMRSEVGRLDDVFRAMTSGSRPAGS